MGGKPGCQRRRGRIFVQRCQGKPSLPYESQPTFQVRRRGGCDFFGWIFLVLYLYAPHVFCGSWYDFIFSPSRMKPFLDIVQNKSWLNEPFLFIWTATAKSFAIRTYGFSPFERANFFIFEVWVYFSLNKTCRRDIWIWGRKRKVSVTRVDELILWKDGKLIFPPERGAGAIFPLFTFTWEGSIPPLERKNLLLSHQW